MLITRTRRNDDEQRCARNGLAAVPGQAETAVIGASIPVIPSAEFLRLAFGFLFSQAVSLLELPRKLLPTDPGA